MTLHNTLPAGRIPFDRRRSTRQVVWSRVWYDVVCPCVNNYGLLTATYGLILNPQSQ